MNIKEELKSELTQEYHTTKKFFDLFPEGKDDYAPHEKSMKLKPLVKHISDIFGWPDFMIKTDYLDLGAGSAAQQVPINNRADLLNSLDAAYQKGLQSLDNLDEKELDKRWQLRHSGHVLADWTKYQSLRHALNQITHHRAQLGVYYRTLDIPLPSSYGPSADIQTF